MRFSQLEYFVALARERHFARAAQACYVSQPALSESIRKLERELGVQLVKRGRNFEGLTDEGERALVWAHRILADHSALEQEINVFKSELTGHLRLGVIPSASYMVAQVTGRFCARHPSASVQLYANQRSGEVIERIHSYELDAGVIYLDERHPTDLRVMPLAEESYELVVGAQLLASHLPQYDGEPHSPEPAPEWADILALPLCLLSVGMRGRDVLDEVLSERGLAAKPQVETDSMTTVLAHVSTGQWASLVPHSWFAALNSAVEIKRVPLPDPVRATMGLVTSSDEPSSLLVHAFLKSSLAEE